MAHDILTDLKRATAALPSRDKRVTVDRSYLEDAADEIERLRKVKEIAKAFLSEWDNPTPDYALRVNLKQRLRALCQ